MSVNNFVPEIWSANILDAYEKKNLFRSLLNTDYQGEITNFGDTVRINELGDIAISTYVKNSTTAITVQELTDAQQTLTIDRAKYFAFKLDDVDNAQTNPKLMQKAIAKSAYALSDDTDIYIATTLSSGGFFAGTNSTELGSTVTALSVTSTLVITALAWASRIMDQNNVPSEGRFVVVPPAIHHQMVLARIVQDTSNSRFLDGGPQSVGNFYNFDIYVSNNVYGVISSQWHVLYGHRDAVTFASQLVKTEAYRDQNSFSDVVRGLFVYGMKTVRPNALIKGVHTA
jgi:hypothetical protein